MILICDIKIEKMSIFGIKDLDHKLGELLDDKNLKVLNYLNKTCIRIYDEAFYKRRFLKYLNTLENYSVLPESNVTKWKIFYYTFSKYISSKNHVKIIKTLIEEDEDYMLSLLFRKYKYSNATIYDWYGHERDYLSPMDYVISKDSKKCFDYLFQFQHIDTENIFRNHAHKIMNSKNEFTSPEMKIIAILSIFQNGCITCFNSIYSESYKQSIIELLYIADPEDISHLTSVYSAAFSAFMKTWTSQELLYYRNDAFIKNRYNLVKLYTIYTSIFSEYTTKNF